MKKSLTALFILTCFSSFASGWIQKNDFNELISMNEIELYITSLTDESIESTSFSVYKKQLKTTHYKKRNISICDHLQGSVLKNEQLIIK